MIQRSHFWLFIQRIKKKTNWKRNMHPYVHCSIIYNSQCMDKEDVRYKCMCVCVCAHACVRAQLCPALCNPMDCSPPCSSVHGIILAWILEWIAMPSSRGSSWPRDWTHVSCIGRWILYHWAMREVPIHTVGYYSAIKRMKCCHLQQHECI